MTVGSRQSPRKQYNTLKMKGRRKKKSENGDSEVDSYVRDWKWNWEETTKYELRRREQNERDGRVESVRFSI